MAGSRRGASADPGLADESLTGGRVTILEGGDDGPVAAEAESFTCVREREVGNGDDRRVGQSSGRVRRIGDGESRTRSIGREGNDRLAVREGPVGRRRRRYPHDDELAHVPVRDGVGDGRDDSRRVGGTGSHRRGRRRGDEHEQAERTDEATSGTHGRLWSRIPV
ncbi:hypothetical protein ACFQL0_09705 [Haloplanus litoreus]|uniref:hypothetical protein n=1 Tax=Haloplanus litoreus TaxID=767515 RepID=UPI0036158799